MSASKHNTQHFDLGVLQMQILWLVGRTPMHGYELMRQLNDIKSTKVEQGTLYPALQKLEEQEFIQVKETGRRGKKIYELTEAGREAMVRTCEEFSKTFSGIFEDFVCKSCR